jgi:hypothetical protein
VISNADIANALGQQLTTLYPELAIGWPNRDVPSGTPHPYLIFDLVPVSRTEGTIKGGHAISRGFAQVTVMSEIGLFTSASMVKGKSGNQVQSAGVIADSVAALFPFGLRMDVTGGKVLINQPPEVQQGYPDGPHWRIPVRIPYEARA